MPEWVQLFAGGLGAFCVLVIFVCIVWNHFDATSGR